MSGHLKAKIEDHDDWKYRPMLKKDTKGNHGEDYEKIEGSLEGSHETSY